MGVAGTELTGVEDAVSFIARLRQTKDLSKLQSSLGRNIVVVGGGMTAIDAAVQSKLLGAENVTVVYRRDQSQMNASVFEQELAQKNGVLLRTNLQPAELLGDGEKLTGVRFEYTGDSGGKLKGTGEMLDIDCDQALIAIGQALIPDILEGAELELSKGRIKVDDDRRTTDSSIWAGGDCIAGGDDLTVSAVQDGKLAAESIHQSLEQAHG